MRITHQNLLLFTYGTLKRGFPNHSVMQQSNANFIGDAITQFTYPLIQTGKWNSPYMLHHKNHLGSHRITGELFEVDEKGIDILDDFEGVHSRNYKRLEIEVITTCNLSEITKTAWCYFRHDDSLKLLEDTSQFIPYFGKEELKKYTAVHLRPRHWRKM